MINAKIDDKKCVVTLKGIENNAKNMNRAMRISFNSAQKEPL